MIDKSTHFKQVCQLLLSLIVALFLHDSLYRLYHDIRFTVVGIDPGLVVHGVGQVSMQTRGTRKESLGLS